MKGSGIKRRITSILLTAVMALSVTGYAFEGAYAAGENEAEAAAAEASSEQSPESGAEESVAEESVTEESVGDLPDGDPVSEETELGMLSAAEEEAAPGEIAIAPVRNENRVIELAWEPVSGAEYYLIALDGDEPERMEAAGADEEQLLTKTYEDVDPKQEHSVSIKAYGEGSGSAGTEGLLIAGGSLEGISAYVTAGPMRGSIGKMSIKPENLGINLKEMLGEKHNGYSVAQGGCTDGEYVYYLMVSSHTQKGRILKTRVEDNTVVDRSDVINICHGNGMTINTRENKLVIVGREERRNQLTVVDAEDLKSVSYVDVGYGYSGSWNNYKSNGLSAISYIRKYDCYVALQRSTHEILVLNTDFDVVAQVGTVITAKYPGTYQAMDADERYVYLLLSYYSSRQPHNIVLVLDWNSEKLLDVVNGKKTHIKKSWKCNDDGSGTPDAVIRTGTPYEAENIYHIDQGDGTARFYLSEYHNNPQYRYVTKKKAYKVKWKKVKKKVKWKRVKKKGKWKWKYKTKKVWKYKKKYKNVKVKELNYYNRDNYVYDLGVI